MQNSFQKLRNQVATPAGFTVTQSIDILNNEASSCHLAIDITTIGTGSVTVSINGFQPDNPAGNVWLILASAALVASALTVLKVGPGLTAGANLVANDVLPKNIRITFTHNNANAIIMSAGIHLIRV